MRAAFLIIALVFGAAIIFFLGVYVGAQQPRPQATASAAQDSTATGAASADTEGQTAPATAKKAVKSQTGTASASGSENTPAPPPGSDTPKAAAGEGPDGASETQAAKTQPPPAWLTDTVAAIRGHGDMTAGGGSAAAQLATAQEQPGASTPPVDEAALMPAPGIYAVQTRHPLPGAQARTMARQQSYAPLTPQLIAASPINTAAQTRPPQARQFIQFGSFASRDAAARAAKHLSQNMNVSLMVVRIAHAATPSEGK